MLENFSIIRNLIFSVKKIKTLARQEFSHYIFNVSGNTDEEPFSVKAI